MNTTYKPNYTSTTLILDGAFFIRRAMYSPNTRELSNKTGVPTGGIFSFFNSLRTTLSSIAATSLVVTWEGGHSDRRNSIYPDYKKREIVDEPELDSFGMTDYEYYKHQLSWVQKILDCYGVPQVMIPGKEGDDVLYQCCHIIKGNKVIVSEDRDFFSLINDDISCYRPIKKEYVCNSNFQEITGYRSSRHFMFAKSILGDGSDNIPQVAKGCGESTVLKILDNIKEPENVTTENILKEAANVGGRANKLVLAGASLINRNLDLVDISREQFNVFELQDIIEILSKKYYANIDMVNKLFDHLDFARSSTSNLTTILSNMTNYPLYNLVNKGYAKEVAMYEGGIL